MISEYTPKKSRVLCNMGKRFGGLVGALNGLSHEVDIVPKPDNISIPFYQSDLGLMRNVFQSRYQNRKNLD